MMKIHKTVTENSFRPYSFLIFHRIFTKIFNTLIFFYLKFFFNSITEFFSVAHYIFFLMYQHNQHGLFTQHLLLACRIFHIEPFLLYWVSFLVQCSIFKKILSFVLFSLILQFNFITMQRALYVTLTAFNTLLKIVHFTFWFHHVKEFSSYNNEDNCRYVDFYFYFFGCALTAVLLCLPSWCCLWCAQWLSLGHFHFLYTSLV